MFTSIEVRNGTLMIAQGRSNVTIPLDRIPDFLSDVASAMLGHARTNQDGALTLDGSGPEVPPPRLGKHGARSTEQSAKAAAVWQAYRDAYYERYGTEPVRNAKSNALAMHLVRRLGDEASEVARFYVWHPDAFFVRSMHSMELLVKNCEGLCVQWRRGQRVTGSMAANVERASVNAFARMANGVANESGTKQARP